VRSFPSSQGKGGRRRREEARARAQADPSSRPLHPLLFPLLSPRSHCMQQGWRYSMYTLGALMLFLWAIRFFVFPMHESPKFLVAKGRDQDAVAVIQAIAKMNGREVHLSAQDLHRAAEPYFKKEGDGAQVAAGFTTFELIKMSFKVRRLVSRCSPSAPLTLFSQQEWDSQQFKMLFATRRLAWSSSLLIFIYAALGLAYPMYKCVYSSCWALCTWLDTADSASSPSRSAFLSGFLAAKGAESGDTSIDYVYGGYTCASCSLSDLSSARSRRARPADLVPPPPRHRPSGVRCHRLGRCCCPRAVGPGWSQVCDGLLHRRRRRESPRRPRRLGKANGADAFRSRRLSSSASPPQGPRRASTRSRAWRRSSRTRSTVSWCVSSFFAEGGLRPSPARADPTPRSTPTLPRPSRRPLAVPATRSSALRRA